LYWTRSIARFASCSPTSCPRRWHPPCPTNSSGGEPTALAELDRAKTAFLTNVSHEFRTPLTLLLGPLDDALSEAVPESVLAERLTTAGRNARRLQRLVDSLLDFSRIEAGRRDDVVLLALRPSHEAACSFATVLSASPTQIPVARGRLRHWLNTIAVPPPHELDILLAAGEAVTNAIEHGSHSEPHRTVSVEAFVRGETVAVTVSDTGRWIGDSSASLRSRRRGRGLTLIGGLADHVDTVRTGTGTRVTLRFDHALAAGSATT
jgi:anti-sigma regulatory factor (Ser/Thr protein kinase)